MLKIGLLAWKKNEGGGCLGLKIGLLAWKKMKAGLFRGKTLPLIYFTN